MEEAHKQRRGHRGGEVPGDVREASPPRDVRLRNESGMRPYRPLEVMEGLEERARQRLSIREGRRTSPAHWGWRSAILYLADEGLENEAGVLEARREF